jgi:hypothetical protein
MINEKRTVGTAHRTKLALPRQKCYGNHPRRFSLHYGDIGAFKQLWMLALSF